MTDLNLNANANETQLFGKEGRRRFRRTLSRDLIVSIIFVVVVVFVMVVSVTYGYMFYKDRLQSQDDLEKFSDYLQSALEFPVWNFDKEGIKKICGSFFENTVVEKLRVVDHQGNVMIDLQRKGHDQPLHKKSSILHGKTLIGYVEIALSSNRLREKQHQLMGFSMITMVAVILVLVITLRFILKLLLISPLNQLIQRTEQISRGIYNPVGFQAPQAEIRTIVSRFNSMVAHIQQRERSLKALNQRLENKIAELQDTESALLNSREELNSIIRSTPDVIYRLDTMGRFTFISDAIRRYGVTPEELIGKRFMDYIHKEDRALAAHRVNDRRTGNRGTKGIAIRAFGDYKKDRVNSRKAVEGSPVFLVDAEGLYVSGESGVKVFVGTQGIARDITKQRQMESARMESEDRLSMALDVSGAGIWQLDLKSGALRVDERIYALLGYKEPDLARGLKFVRKITAPDTWDEINFKFNRHVAGDTPMFDHEFRMQAKQGQWKWFHTKAKVLRSDGNKPPETMVGIIVDTTERKENEAERKRLESKLQQAQKMEAIGTLAGGIAHDFNNILGAMVGYTQLAQLHGEGDSRIQRYVENILKASERAKGLVDQILTFTRQGKSQKVPCDIAVVLKEVVKLIRASIPTTVRIVHTIPTKLGTVMADQTQIHQVLMNLCTNAAHAMEKRGGTLTVTLEPLALEEADLSPGIDDLKPGLFLQLSVADTGAGMDPAVAERIFEPYFTTKAPGEGTGMGLATVHGIVRDHGGRIFVQTHPGEGTVFRVLFPVLDDEVQADHVQPDSYQQGTERILFVDDEKTLTRVGVEMLNALGYDAVGTTSPVEALTMFKEDPDGFDLVITDMTMPHLTGDQLAEAILQYRPDIPVIICTGFSKFMTSTRASTLGVRALLMKPVTVEKLSRTIRDVLDAPPQE
ncbi:two component system sensor histidine kinase [Desulfosarcina variabilis str. Montpellier]|uniref:PAS domain S-box protein n=1 Tax=Desulfosarcina variabilis TaxID=2300 RepID=UPI003AFB1650